MEVEFAPKKIVYVHYRTCRRNDAEFAIMTKNRLHPIHRIFSHPGDKLFILLYEFFTTRFNPEHFVVHMQYVLGQVCNC